MSFKLKTCKSIGDDWQMPCEISMIAISDIFSIDLREVIARYRSIEFWARSIYESLFPWFRNVQLCTQYFDDPEFNPQTFDAWRNAEEEWTRLTGLQKLNDLHGHGFNDAAYKLGYDRSESRVMPPSSLIVHSIRSWALSLQRQKGIDSQLTVDALQPGRELAAIEASQDTEPGIITAEECVAVLNLSNGSSHTNQLLICTSAAKQSASLETTDEDWPVPMGATELAKIMWPECPKKDLRAKSKRVERKIESGTIPAKKHSKSKAKWIFPKIFISSLQEAYRKSVESEVK